MKRQSQCFKSWVALQSRRVVMWEAANLNKLAFFSTSNFGDKICTLIEYSTDKCISESIMLQVTWSLMTVWPKVSRTFPQRCCFGLVGALGRCKAGFVSSGDVGSISRARNWKENESGLGSIGKLTNPPPYDSLLSQDYVSGVRPNTSWGWKSLGRL